MERVQNSAPFYFFENLFDFVLTETIVRVIMESEQKFD